MSSQVSYWDKKAGSPTATGVALTLSSPMLIKFRGSSVCHASSLAQGDARKNFAVETSLWPPLQLAGKCYLNMSARGRESKPTPGGAPQPEFSYPARSSDGEVQARGNPTTPDLSRSAGGAPVNVIVASGNTDLPVIFVSSSYLPLKTTTSLPVVFLLRFSVMSASLTIANYPLIYPQFFTFAPPSV